MTAQTTAARTGITLTDTVTLPLEIVTATVAVLANRGGGKSSVAHLMVERMFGADLPVVVLDVKGDWWGIRSSADGAGQGLPFVIFGGDHGDVPLEPTAGELLADLIVDHRVPAVLDLSHMSKTQARNFATAFAERLYRRNRDPLHVVIEEADVLVPQRVTAGEARLLGAMEDLAKRGRHRGIGLSILTQRPQEVAKSVLDLMETVVLLRMSGPRSIKAVQDWISVNADQDDATVRDVISSLPALPVGHGWVWSPGFLRILQRTTFPKFNTFDSHATPAPRQSRVVPKVRAEIDLDTLGAEIAATRDRARDTDARTLSTVNAALRADLAAANERVDAATAQLADQGRQISELHAQVVELESRVQVDVAAATTTLRQAAGLIGTALDALTTTGPLSTALTPTLATPTPATPTPAPASIPAATQPLNQPRRRASTPNGVDPKFNAGVNRMIIALARMAPLRLTKTQWSTVSGIKHTGGTWTTYLSRLRQAGFVDQNHAGFTLTDAGWSYLGERPAPMTANELQQHFLSILRKGAGRMLEAIMAAYPRGLTRTQIADAAEIASTGGTFTTYLSDLTRNGLIEKQGNLYVATDVLMKGADMEIESPRADW
ncbi:hypothetical protein BKG82_28385 [Mycobacteroides chelonae]|uniref:Helicase HerA central domain-containing protein n=1 Tax=Mycobacteroides chelonae TaxID=1774 RepID=A0A1S1LFI9_MYCCH|nr:DUF87 domain-containing protein [Mycobacteroides chelonae]OHU46103.1 hypothetical protein BKG82_28385 [Mycobacteroides chelonae]